MLVNRGWFGRDLELRLFEQGGLAFGSAFTPYLLCDLKQITVPLEISVFSSVSWEY